LSRDVWTGQMYERNIQGTVIFWMQPKTSWVEGKEDSQWQWNQ
jgi:hypothetical protein